MPGTWTSLARRARARRISATLLLIAAAGYGGYSLWPKSLTTEPILYGEPVSREGWALHLRSGQTLKLSEINEDDPLIVSGDGHTIVYLLDGRVLARDLRDGTAHDLAGADRLNGLQTSSDGRHVAISYRDRTVITDLRTGERRTIPDICQVTGLSATVVWGLPDCEHQRRENSRLVTVQRDGTGAFVGKLSSGLVSPDLRLVASYRADSTLISDAMTGEKVKSIKHEDAGVLAWHNDHEIIVEESPYQVIDVRTGTRRRDAALPDAWIPHIAWPGAGNDRLG